MRNRTFTIQKPHHRKGKLAAVIRARTHNALTTQQMQTLVAGASASFQHTIMVYTDADAFCLALTLQNADNHHDYGKVIFGPAILGSEDEGVPGKLLSDCEAAAIITTHYNLGRGTMSTMHIYVPPQCYHHKEASHHGQGEKTASGL